MNITEQQLRAEAQFADEHYATYANDLAVNPGMLKKYTHPQDAWDWRQYGASVLGKIQGCRLLDLGCGMGEESVYFALLGAQVTSVDISQVGVEMTRKRAVRNGVADRIQAHVMRADETEFPNESFDVVHGFGILHHIGLQRGVQETKRLLRPGGRALFFEHMGNSAFVENLRKRADYTEYEKPVVWRELVECGRQFSKFSLKPYHVLSRGRSFLPMFGKPAFRKLDHQLLKTLPPLRHFASGVVIYLEN